MKSIHADENGGYDADKKELKLSHRNLREVDNAIIASYGDCTEYLDISHNSITRLEWIYAFPRLKSLIVDDNRLREAHLEKLKVSLPKITTLTLNKNELSDLDTTVNIIKQTFPNLEYLSLHGNPMCPDNLLLQPFSEFVPYEYSHYRTVLKNSLPNLKFLDHFSLEASSSPSTMSDQVNHQQKLQQQLQHNDRVDHFPSTSRDLWAKLKSFLTLHQHHPHHNKDSSTSSDDNITTLPSTSATRSSCARPCAPSSDSTYKGVHSEGNRFITNSDL